MLEMAINNVEMGSELDRVHILTCCAGLNKNGYFNRRLTGMAVPL